MKISTLKIFLLFALFGLATLLCSFIVYYFFLNDAIHHEFRKDAEQILLLKKEQFETTLKNAGTVAEQFKRSPYFQAFTDAPTTENLHALETFALAFADSHADLISLSFIDHRAQERLHLEKNTSGSTAVINTEHFERCYAPEKSEGAAMDASPLSTAYSPIHLACDLPRVKMPGEAHITLKRAVIQPQEHVGTLYFVYSLTRFVQALKKIELVNLYLTDDQGKLLIDPRQLLQPGTGFDDLQKRFPMQFKKILGLSHYQGDELLGTDLVISDTIRLKLIAQINHKPISTIQEHISTQLAGLLVLLLLLSTFASYMLGQRLTRLYTYLESIIDGMGEGLFVLDRNHHVKLMNRSAEQILGYESSELVGKNSHYIVHPTDREGNPKPLELCPVMQLENTMTPFSGQLDLFRRKDGTFIDVEITASPLVIKQRFDGSVTLFKNVTHSLKLERERTLQAELFAALADAVFIYTPEGELIYANRCAWRERGYSETELMQLPVYMLDAGTNATDSLAIADGLKENPNLRLQTEHRRKDGSTFPVEIHAKRVIVDRQPFIISVVRDITEQLKAQNKLALSEEKYRTLVQNSLVGIFRTDIKGNVLYANPALHTMLEYEDDVDLAQYNVNDLYNDPKVRQTLLAQLSETGTIEGFEIEIKTRSGALKTALLCASLKGEMIMGILLDVTERVEAERKLRQLSQIVEQVDDSVIMTDTLGVITFVNAAFLNLTGYRAEEVLGRNANILKSSHHDDTFYNRLWQTIGSGQTFKETFLNKKRNGELFYEYKTISPIKDNEGKTIAYVSTAKDITERIAMEERLKELAHKDYLTGLYNRLKFENTLEHELNLTRRYGNIFSLVMLDIDYFKQVNDTYGHQVGDEILKEFTLRLQKRLRVSDMLARWGGEEFIVLLPNTDVTTARAIADELRLCIESKPFKTTGLLTVSLGVTQVRKEDSMHALLKRVDDALYKAKESGRNRVVIV